MKRLITITALVSALALTVGCNEDDARVASANLSKAADNFEVMRRVIFYNSWTDTNMMVVEGRCSIEDETTKFYIVCKVGDGKFRKDFLGRNQNVTYFVEQMELVDVSVYHYRRTWKPQAVIPDIDFRGDAGALERALTPDSSD